MKLNPYLAPATYVFCKVDALNDINTDDILCMFRETEGITLILKKAAANRYKLSYDYEAAWIALRLETALDMVGLTAEFSNALADEGISCNVIAAYHHDHIFVDIEDANKAIDTLRTLEI